MACKQLPEQARKITVEFFCKEGFLEEGLETEHLPMGKIRFA